MSIDSPQRDLLHLDSTLFPGGIPPESIVEVTGSSGSGKTLLLTYLLAKFLLRNPGKRAVFIDTTSHFRAENLSKMLNKMDPDLKFTSLKEDAKDGFAKNPALLAYLQRVEVISCCSPEDLLFCFGPRNGSKLEAMLQIVPEISLVLIDSLDNFTYCPSLKGIDSTEYPDLLQMLRRNLSSTKTPAICAMRDKFHENSATWTSRDSPRDSPKSSSSGVSPGSSNYTFQSLPPPSQTSSSDIYNVPKSQDQRLEPNFTFDRRVFTHNILLHRVETNGKAVYSAYLRCKKNPNMALSLGNHCVKFSILSGILEWIQESPLHI